MVRSFKRRDDSNPPDLSQDSSGPSKRGKSYDEDDYYAEINCYAMDIWKIGRERV